jgi:hypothetical protein
MKRLAIVLATVTASAVALQVPAWSSGSDKVLEFDTMAPVDGPFVGTANPIRGVNGGGLPWQIDDAKGSLTADGKLEVKVRGLVLLAGDPVPPERQGTNPIPEFRATVSCLTEADGAVATVNVATDPFPADVEGDARISATVPLPHPCVAPIVFVGPSATAWFAATGVA